MTALRGTFHFAMTTLLASVISCLYFVAILFDVLRSLRLVHSINMLAKYIPTCEQGMSNSLAEHCQQMPWDAMISMPQGGCSRAPLPSRMMFLAASGKAGHPQQFIRLVDRGLAID